MRKGTPGDMPRKERQMNNPRTSLSDELLEKNIKIMQDMIRACRMCVKQGASFSEACNKNGLNIRKMRYAMVQIAGLSGRTPRLKDITLEDLYDPYENFYRYVFGNSISGDTSLPVDYHETVLYVLNHIGITDRNKEIVMRYFGLGDFMEPSTMEAVGKIYGITKEGVRTDLMTVARRCHEKHTCEILQYGIQEYRVKKSILEAETRMKIETELKAHEKRLDTIRESVSGISMETPHADLMTELERTPIDLLWLPARAYNALKSRDISDLYALMKTIHAGTLLQIKNMGTASEKRTVEELDGYLAGKYGIDLQSALHFLFGKSPTAEPARYWKEKSKTWSYSQ